MLHARQYALTQDFPWPARGPALAEQVVALQQLANALRSDAEGCRGLTNGHELGRSASENLAKATAGILVGLMSGEWQGKIAHRVEKGGGRAQHPGVCVAKEHKKLTHKNSPPKVPMIAFLRIRRRGADRFTVCGRLLLKRGYCARECAGRGRQSIGFGDCGGARAPSSLL